VANYSIPVTVPRRTLMAGPATFTTAIFRIYPAGGIPATEFYTAPITLGSEMSEELVVGRPE
jgi:hypothetical protein